MDQQREVRVSDSDREEAAERLGSAVTEGRLNLQEYDDRLGRAYQSVTYGDLEDLFVDLPRSGSGAAAPRETAPGSTSRPKATPSGAESTLGALGSYGFLGTLPRWLRVLWTIWLAKVAINLTVWALVSVSDATVAYFWPVWVIGPPGALLLTLTAIARTGPRSNHPTNPLLNG
ncbi:DUF1707 domain-containing protein [Sphaerisporangium flaviroseum]|uniref:DUF1707 domain-containing protein n=1 Tax=Sphaerisporangium flaviroseum TaxID=509199 RepID=A0ABP7IX25_9ACTN